MNSQLNHITMSSSAIPIPLTQSLIEKAKEVVAQLPEAIASERYATLLATGVVKSYLDWLDITADLKASDTWNPTIQLMGHPGDLVLPGLGKLECRPVLAESESCWVAPETPGNRIGLVAVALDETAKTANLVGFMTPIKPGEVSIRQLQPIDVLLGHLEQLEQTSQSRVNLQQWLDGVLSTGWQMAETVFRPQQTQMALAMGLRTTASPAQAGVAPPDVQGVTLLDLGMDLEPQSVALFIALRRDTDEQVTVRVQLHPNTDETYLPTGIKLILMDQAGTSLKEVQARQSDNLIQLPQFIGQTNEEFHIQLVLGERSIQKSFTL